MNATSHTAWAGDVVAGFVNLGGAIVELHTARFMTQWLSGPPYACDEPYAVDGWNWRCRGCAAYGREGDSYNDPGFRKLAEARGEAQAHAEKCRAVPLLTELTGWEYLVESYRDKWTTFENVLERHCRSGWELVTVDWDGRRVVFRRPARGAA
ncbi:hypothetical protein ACFYUV_11290 [Nonomuraea sp. NPDC003560]|uniref:hypothetical protein n=1 Tax=Nonomuraea sp. NPDC003560 TaxID=3364341 RepID=UPI0036C0445D